MSHSTLESQVKKESGLLAKQVSSILSESSLMEGKFVALFEGTSVTGDTHLECFKKAEKQFGTKGFAIAEITSKKPVVSALVKF